MSSLNVMPVQWSQFHNIDDVEPVNENDAQYLKEIYGVLKKHGKESRLGVALLHKHFQLNDDEIMLEVTDETNRELITAAVSAEAAGKGNIITIFALKDGDTIEAMSHCHQYCKRGTFGNHFTAHRKME